MPTLNKTNAALSEKGTHLYKIKIFISLQLANDLGLRHSIYTIPIKQFTIFHFYDRLDDELIVNIIVKKPYKLVIHKNKKYPGKELHVSSITVAAANTTGIYCK